MKNSISNTINWNGQKVTFTWIPTFEIEEYQPIRNVVGVCLNDNQEVSSALFSDTNSMSEVTGIGLATS